MGTIKNLQVVSIHYLPTSMQLVWRFQNFYIWKPFRRRNQKTLHFLNSLYFCQIRGKFVIYTFWYHLYDFLINKFLNCTPVHYVSYLSLMWFLANHLSSFRISHLFSVLLTGLQVFHIVPPATNLNCFQVPHSRLPHHSRYSPLRLSCFLFYSISSVDGITIT